ncbi:MAG: acylphosphatase [Trueperaceae bacterium]|nr:acylphosphatase [Trueperaceae bacterium]
MTDTNEPRLTALLSGRVQGVGFRAFIQRHALDMSLRGYAENLDDGRVEVVAEGDRDELERLLEKLRQGPAHAVVRDIDVSWGEASDLEGFHTY